MPVYFVVTIFYLLVSSQGFFYFRTIYIDQLFALSIIQLSFFLSPFLIENPQKKSIMDTQKNTVTNNFDEFNVSLVRSANHTDDRTAELLRRELSDLMHRQGWNYKAIRDSFNNMRLADNKRKIHFNNIKAAMRGIKKHRALAYEIEQYMLIHDGPFKEEAIAIDPN